MWNSEEGGFPLQRCCLVFGLIVVTAGQTAHAAPVNFADANLKACVEAALNVSNPTPTDMLALTELQVCRNKGITDLTGIAYATNLTDLDLQRNQISDISALAGLTDLTDLDLQRNQISDISALAGLTNLEGLILSDNQISDISALAGLTNLANLRLPNNQISDISPLSGLTNLTGLRLESNLISNISPLSGLTSLTDLRLYDNQISDISALAGLTSLTDLSLSRNQISEISPLSWFTKLNYLSLYSNPLHPEACDIYIPQIKANNPSVILEYDVCVPCDKFLTVSSTTGGSTTTPAGDGEFPYYCGSIVPLVGSPQIGYHFVNWTGDSGTIGDTSDPVTTITMDGDYTIQANFAPGTHILTRSSSAGGSVTAPGEGSFGSYSYGMVVNIVATPETGYRFVNWTGDTGTLANTSDPTTTIAINGASIQANFAPDTHSLTTSSSAGGSVTTPGEGSFGRYDRGTEVDLVATPQSGYHFVNWTGKTGNIRNRSHPTTTIAMYRDYNIQANFAEADPNTITDPNSVFDPNSRTLYVDDDGANDPGPYDPTVSDPDEDGSQDHPYDEIQEGIKAANDHDTVLVLPGTYYETIHLMGKNINLTGFDPIPANVGFATFSVAANPAINPYPIIDASYAGTVVTFDEGEDPNCVLSGFVLTRGFNRPAGAIACYGASPVIRNCLIIGNLCEDPHIDDPYGGVVYCVDSNSLFENCTITDNHGAENGAALRVIDCDVIITNSIIWGNSPNQVLVDSGNDPVIVYSDVQGGWWGLGNIDIDPLFVEPGLWTDPDGLWMGGDYHLLPESPSIDAGDPDSSLGNEPGPNGGRINQGAYGGTDHASKSSQSPLPLGWLGTGHSTRLVAHWPFDETSGSIAEDVAGGFHGAVHGTQWTTGRISGALRFDGIDDYVECGNSPLLAPDMLTAAVWVRPEYQLAARSLIRKAGSDITQFDYRVYLNLIGRINFSFSDQETKRRSKVRGQVKLTNDEWTHVAVTRDGSVATLYINGMVDTSKAYDFTPISSGLDLVLGGGSRLPFKGKLDEVQIYNEALTEAEIQALANVK